MTDNTSPIVALVSYEGVQESAVLGLKDLFTLANSSAQPKGAQAISLRDVTPAEIAVWKDERLDAIILPPNISNARGEKDTYLHNWLKEQHARGSLLCSVCAGAFWLGHSGLLDGRPATTHWALAEEFQNLFPKVQVNAELLLIDDHDLVTAGGLMAWLDLGLFLVNRWLGPQAVSATARTMLIDPNGRQQKNYRSFQPPLTHGDRTILALQHWLESHAEEEITVTALAERSNLSDRTFLRRFKAATGYSPNSYLQNLRVEKARGLLERTRIPVSEIGWKVGYQDASAFSRVFRNSTGLTAGEYRNRFGLLARV
ncbi:GlxA family transcriptional regulator [Rhodovibrionaceae bacterium A322]